MTDAKLLDPPLLPLWRAPGVLQLGSEGFVVLERVPTEFAHAITLLTHPQTQVSLKRLLPRLDAAWVDWLWTELGRHGFLRNCVRTKPIETEVVGSGDLATRIADALASSPGLSVSLTRDIEVATMPGHALRRDWVTPPNLLVVATQTVEPDRTITDELVQAGIPHLIVRVEPTRAAVGPFVVPGITGCVRCLDLTRAYYDTAWPRLLAQLCRASPQPPEALTAWAVATAVLQVRAHAAGHAPDTLGRILEVRADELTLSAMDLPAHPDCRCQLDPDERDDI